MITENLKDTKARCISPLSPYRRCGLQEQPHSHSRSTGTVVLPATSMMPSWKRERRIGRYQKNSLCPRSPSHLNGTLTIEQNESELSRSSCTRTFFPPQNIQSALHIAVFCIRRVNQLWIGNTIFSPPHCLRSLQFLFLSKLCFSFFIN